MTGKIGLKGLLVWIQVWIVVFVWWNPSLFCAYPLSTDDAPTVEQSKYELEFWYDYLKVSGEPRSHSFGLSFKHGITNKMDIGISFPITIEPKPKERLGVATLGLKYQLLKDTLSFTLSNELGSREYFINGIFSHGILQGMLHLNLGYEASGDPNTKGNVTYSFAYEYPVKKSDIVFEFLGDKNGFQDYLFGLRYNFAEGFAFGVAYGNGFKDTNERITFGFHYEF